MNSLLSRTRRPTCKDRAKVGLLGAYWRTQLSQRFRAARRCVSSLLD